MAHRLGISLYPEKSDPERDRSYLQLAKKYGFQRVFTCLLSASGDQDEILQRFRQTILAANQLEMEVIADISPRIFKRLGISYHDLSFFQQLGVDGIRLDLGFSGLEEALMTHNPYNLKIEINMSSGTKYIENIIAHRPKRENLIASHNFYPHRYTGLSYQHFLRCSKAFKDLGIQTAAFINSHHATFGPWEITEGLCTLEMHRDLPITVQAKHLLQTGLIDDIIIGNAYASEEELKQLSQLINQPLTFMVELSEQITALEKKILLKEPHFYRGDISDYVIRSTQSRVKYKKESFPPTNTPDIRRGDILIDNELYGQYKGELQIALQEMKNSGKTNVIGRIVPEELFLLDTLHPWDQFRFQVRKK